MIDIEDLRMFRALSSTGVLAGAARMLDLTPPALTIRLKKLEERLGVLLVVRGARGITFTEEGLYLVEEAAEILERIEAVPERISSDTRAMAGNLRIVAPFGFGRKHIAPLVRDFHRAHPHLAIVLNLSENPIADASGADLVIHIGAVKDSSWVGHCLAANERLVCASPEFVRRMGRLTHPSQLGKQPCLCLRENNEDLTRWRFSVRDRKKINGPHGIVNVRVSGALSSNDGMVISDWATQGLGIMLRSEWEAAPLIASGRLIQLFPDWQLDPAPVMALVPSRKGVSTRIHVLIEAARAALTPVPWRVLGMPDSMGRR